MVEHDSIAQPAGQRGQGGVEQRDEFAPGGFVAGALEAAQEREVVGRDGGAGRWDEGGWHGYIPPMAAAGAELTFFRIFLVIRELRARSKANTLAVNPKVDGRGKVQGSGCRCGLRAGLETQLQRDPLAVGGESGRGLKQQFVADGDAAFRAR